MVSYYLLVKILFNKKVYCVNVSKQYHYSVGEKTISMTSREVVIYFHNAFEGILCPLLRKHDKWRQYLRPPTFLADQQHF